MDRSPRDDTKLVMRGKDVSDTDPHSRDAPKSPVMGMGKRNTLLSESASLIPLQTPGKNPHNRTIRASSPFHEIQDHDTKSSDRPLTESSRTSSVKITSTSPYQASIPGIRSINEMRASPGGHLNTTMPNAGTKGHLSPKYHQGEVPWDSRNSPTHDGVHAWPNGQMPFYNGQPMYFPYHSMPSGHAISSGPDPRGLHPGYAYPGYPYPWAPPPPASTAVAPVAPKGRVKPDYAGMTDAQRQDARDIFEAEFKVMDHKYKEKKLPMIKHGMSLEAIDDLYEMNLQSLETDETAGQFRMLLQIVIMGLEYAGKRFFGVDMSKFTKRQMANMHKYDRLLLILGRKWSGDGTGMRVEWKIIIMLILNAILVVLSNLFASKTGADSDEAYGFVNGLGESYIDGMTDDPIPKAVDPLTGIRKTPIPKDTNPMWKMASNFMGMGNGDNIMDTVTSMGGEYLANMEVNTPQQRAPRQQPVNEPRKPAATSRRRRRVAFDSDEN